MTSLFKRIMSLLFGSDDNISNNTKHHDRNDKSDNFEKRSRRYRSFENRSYLFDEMTLSLTDEICFRLRYVVKMGSVWIVGKDFAKEIGILDNEKINHLIDSCVDFVNIKPINQLLSTTSTTSEQSQDDQTIKCINLEGALQLLENVPFVYKSELIDRLVKNVNDIKSKLPSSSSSSSKAEPNFCEQKLTRIIEAIDRNNQSLMQCNKHLIEFEKRFKDHIVELEKRISQFENVDELYTKLREHHTKKRSGSISNLSFLSERQQEQIETTLLTNDNIKYATVKFPRDESKHPRLAVYAKPKHEGGTMLSFLSGQQRNINCRKRKYTDMELVYDSVHPNPILALHCIDEELQNKNYSFIKRGYRSYHIDCDIETVKSFIHENV
ncbi:ac13 [Hemileuca sp. nucleopolyhedrovirus]|uniref:Ac13 n=1 Tax=Hemileuca sp. nucleopolyhedrovirus TaxID=1367203 RepID=S5MQE3_9ABAC|nr:ac13 [Hemileuca sp. nucleopolyhedrovirus]AGR56888.1 ac13 [Hemileuca sp. nucleopolyhedrovirus]